jgi:hypothetical protein
VFFKCTYYYARFYFDPNGIIMAYGDAHYLFQIFQHGTARVARIEMITTYTLDPSFHSGQALAGWLAQVLADGTTGWAVNIPEWYEAVSEEATPTPAL